MERSEVSVHEVKVFLFLQRHRGWVSSRDISESSGVAPRTARSHALRLVKLGIFDQADVFPGHRYRLSPMAPKRNAAYLRRLTESADVLGMT